ncbi:MAG: tyrosine-type recombinase/integrase, partial [Verrucomicrobia bacterium]|nr:tyrosine-type recombinase/integrase [Verrucomicrobiota bacterium]
MNADTIQGHFPVLLREFFCQRLLTHRGASPQTVKSYRDAFRLFLRFVEARTKKSPTEITLTDFDTDLVLAFLDHLETDRGNSVRTRNSRLTAIRSFMHYVSLRDPTSLPIAQRVLAIPTKRFDRPLLGFLSREEMEAIIQAPNVATWSGRRDQVLFATFYNTGGRVSELVGLNVGDIALNGSAFVRFEGKGRKERAIPLWRSTVRRLRQWLTEIDLTPTSPVFPNRTRNRLTRSGVEYRLRVAVREATVDCPSLEAKNISPHTLRHTTAMALLQAGVPLTT